MNTITPESEKLAALHPTQLKRLLEISILLSSTLALKPLLRLVIEVAKELTNTEAASILLFDRKTGQLRFVSATGQADPSDSIVPLEGSIAGWIVQNGQPLIINDVAADKRHFQGVDSTIDFVTRNLLGVPLATKGDTIGALEVLNKRDNTNYTEQDTALLQALASQAAIAIENARLFQQTDQIAEIMHELKTPLMAITAGSELLAYSDLAEQEQLELIQIIQRESQRLSKMTHDYLELARMESGRVHLELEPVDLLLIVNDVVTMQRPQAAERSIEICVEGQPTLPSLIGDSNRLKQVLLNLVSNAIKYNNDRGKITLTLGTKNNEIVLSVADTGPGITPEDLEMLFERFYRVRGSESRSEGSGLGLSIAQKILEDHGGRIEVVSTVGVGTTFFCYLPLTAMAEQVRN